MDERFRFTTPFKKPVKFEDGLKTGFIVFPHSIAVPNGWGEPLTDEEGNSIYPPGTPSGENPKKLIGYKDGEWKSYRSASLQVAGAIDWRGPYIDENADVPKRYLLSWHGPTQRYWNAGTFVYGSDPQHNEIYMGGGLLTVAPNPVLGAAVKVLDYVDEQGLQHVEKYIVAICKNGDGDIMYARPYQAPRAYASVTDEVREGMQAFYSETTPEGWFEMGRMEADTSDGAPHPPDTPWFFNESCTEARTMRRTAYTYDPGDASSVTDDVYVEYKVRIVLTEEFKNAIFVNLRLEPGNYFDYYEDVDKSQLNPYVDLEGHDWLEDIYTAYFGCNGSTRIAVDYREDTPVYAWWVQNANRSHIRYWMLGIDDIGEPESNNGDLIGTFDPRGDGLPGYHRSTVLLGVDESVILKIGPSFNSPILEYVLQFVKTGTSTYFYTGLNSNEDNVLYFFEGAYTYLHHLDMRDPLLLVGYSDAVSNFYGTVSANRDTTIEKFEWTQFNSPAQEFVANGEFLMRWNSPTTSTTPAEGFTRAEMETWATSFTQSFSRVTWGGGWIDPNFNEVIYTPYVWDFYDSTLQGFEEAFCLRVHTLQEILRDTEKNYRSNAVWGVDENGNALISYEYFDLVAGETVQGHKLYPDGDLPEAVGYGDQFYTGGVI